MAKDPIPHWSAHVKSANRNVDTQVQYKVRSDGMVRVTGFAVHVSLGYVKSVILHQFVGRSDRTTYRWSTSSKKSTISVTGISSSSAPYLANQRPSYAVIQVTLTNGATSTVTHEIG